MKKLNVQHIENKRCRQCKARTEHRTVKGRLKYDPKYPRSRPHMERPVTSTCQKCGLVNKYVECPYLLEDLFTI
jgi:hypothetical protein